MGRFCYWHEDGDPSLPEEPPPIARARDALTSALDSVAGQLPGDGWIAGQRVRYLVESARTTEAVEAAAACRADTWWCEALTGFALHAAGDAAGADSAFAAALGAMPNDERCRWEDVSVLLPDHAARRYRALECTARRALGDTLWWLAQPRWSAAGNERRAEHYARHVMSRLERESRSTYELSWGTDTHELIVRYGWPTRWSRDYPSYSDPSSVHVIGHEPHPAFDFLPTDTALAYPLGADEDGWQLTNPEARSRFSPHWARRVGTLSPQLARFPRGDSMLVAVAADVRGDTVLQRETAHAAVVFESGPDTAHGVTHLPLRDKRAVALLMLPSRPLVASVELTDTVSRDVARARLALGSLGAIDGRRTLLSDLLLYDEPTARDGTLHDVAPRAIGRLTIPRSERLGAYWELWRAEAGRDTVTYTLTVTPRGESWVRRMASTLGLAERAAPVHMRFSEPISEAALVSRALAIDLSRVVPGRYDVRLRVETAAGEFAESVRAVRIVKR